MYRSERNFGCWDHSGVWSPAVGTIVGTSSAPADRHPWHSKNCISHVRRHSALENVMNGTITVHTSDVPATCWLPLVMHRMAELSWALNSRISTTRSCYPPLLLVKRGRVSSLHADRYFSMHQMRCTWLVPCHNVLVYVILTERNLGPAWNGILATGVRECLTQCGRDNGSDTSWAQGPISVQWFQGTFLSSQIASCCVKKRRKFTKI